MIPFDPRTGFLLLGLLYLILPTVTWIVLAGQRSLQVRLWCGGGLLIGVATLLTSFRGSMPEWIPIFVVAVMLQTSHVSRIQSLRLDLDLPPRWRLIALLAAVYLLIFTALHIGLQSYVLRGQFNFTVGSALVLYLSALAWRIGQKEQSRSAKWITRVYVLVAAAMLFRVYSLASATATNIIDEGLSAQLLTLAGLLSAVIGHFGYVGLALDRSTRRELKAAAERARDEENRRLIAQIAQLDRQRSLGELSASLGHELNQPLTAILTNAQVAKRGLEIGMFDTPQLADFLDKIVRNTQRASQIIERIRGFIRPSALQNEAVDLNAIVREVADLVGDEARNRQVSFSFSNPFEPMRVVGDPTQLSQVILNVFRNAIDALAHAMRRDIEVSCRHEGEHVILRIRDSGPGLTAESLAQVGTPFFTTKANGLGMGIAISRSIATQHGGTLSLSNVDPSEGSGAVIELALPASPTSLASES